MVCVLIVTESGLLNSLPSPSLLFVCFEYVQGCVLIFFFYVTRYGILFVMEVMVS